MPESGRLAKERKTKGQQLCCKKHLLLGEGHNYRPSKEGTHRGGYMRFEASHHRKTAKGGSNRRVKRRRSRARGELGGNRWDLLSECCFLGKKAVKVS